MRLFPITVLVFAPAILSAQGLVTAVAGNGSVGFSGDGGPATSAALGLPNGLTSDSAGNLFIVDALNKRIRKVDLSGTIRTVAGNGFPIFSGDGGPATSAGLVIVGTAVHQGVVVDKEGNFYLTDSGDNRIRKVDGKSGEITTVAGKGGGAGFSGDGGPAVDAQLSVPYGVALDKAGNLYIADTGNGRIRKVDTKGIITTVVGRGNGFDVGDGGPATAAQLANPADVAVDSKGNIYIADFGNEAIRKVDTSGTIHSIIHNLFGNCQVGTSIPAAHADAGMTVALAIDSADNIYMADKSGACIHKLDTSGNVTTFAGGGIDTTGNGIPANSIGFGSPQGVAVDGAGNVYVADQARGKVFKVSAGPAPTPVITAALNGASFGAGQSLVQGSLASIFGTSLAPSLAGASSIPLPAKLGGVSVTIGGITAPLLVVSPTQINLQVPWNLQSGSADVVVTVNGTVSAKFSATVGGLAAGIFTTQFGVGPAVAINLDGTLAQPVGSIPGLTTRPAKAGDTIIVLATGLGLVKPALASGAAPGSTLTTTLITPTVLIGGVSAQVSFSGLSPQFVGVNQLNVVVPDVPAGVVPIQIVDAGKTSSDKVTMAVGQ